MLDSQIPYQASEIMPKLRDRVERAATKYSHTSLVAAITLGGVATFFTGYFLPTRWFDLNYGTHSTLSLSAWWFPIIIWAAVASFSLKMIEVLFPDRTRPVPEELTFARMVKYLGISVIDDSD